MKVSSRAGLSKPLVGAGKLKRSCARTPGSISQMTCSSSPRPSSSIDETVTRFCGYHWFDERVSGGSAEGITSVTTNRRCRSSTIWPWTGEGEGPLDNHVSITVWERLYCDRESILPDTIVSQPSELV